MAMLHLVDVGKRSVDSYQGVVPNGLIEELRKIARELKGLRVCHINATPYGGGVSELLRSTIPILNDLGLIADWRTISGDQHFFQVTKKIHNGLKGSKDGL